MEESHAIKPWPHWVVLTVTTFLAVMVLLDVYLVLYARPGQSISEQVYDASRLNPIIALAVGIILGHLFWPVR